MKTIIRNACIVNEGESKFADILISNKRIEKINSSIGYNGIGKINEINADGLYLLPGCIDDQVHFREPGLTHKGNIFSESKAAVAGGITSFMDMPNTIPNTLTQELLEEKYSMASKNAIANYSFFMGINQHNLEEALKTNNEQVCGITDDGLYFNDEKGILANYPEYLEKLFCRSDALIALHSEDDNIISNNTEYYKKIYGVDIPFTLHPKIRSEDACITATKRILEIAKKYKNRLHVFHISTIAEANLFDNKISISEKRITAEACVHHLLFSNKDYEQLGSKIKWNPAIKTKEDKEGLLSALLDNKLDIIATDHAPHTIQEKSGSYFNAMSGGPLVQHALPAMFELVHQRKISIEKLVEKMCHNVAEIYRIKDRGYIREGYFADVVLISLNQSWKATPENTLYKCKWSPFEDQNFKSKVIKTLVNGNIVYDNGVFNCNNLGERLKFSRIR
jgi:dihydroorotase